MGKTRNLFKKIRDIKGTFHAKMGLIKDTKKENQESSIKTSISALLTLPKPLCGSQKTVESSERDGNTRPSDLPFEKPVCRSGSNS